MAVDRRTIGAVGVAVRAVGRLGSVSGLRIVAFAAATAILLAPSGPAASSAGALYNAAPKIATASANTVRIGSITSMAINAGATR